MSSDPDRLAALAAQGASVPQNKLEALPGMRTNLDRMIDQDQTIVGAVSKNGKPLFNANKRLGRSRVFDEVVSHFKSTLGDQVAGAMSDAAVVDSVKSLFASFNGTFRRALYHFGKTAPSILGYGKSPIEVMRPVGAQLKGTTQFAVSKGRRPVPFNELVALIARTPGVGAVSKTFVGKAYATVFAPGFDGGFFVRSSIRSIPGNNRMGAEEVAVFQGEPTGGRIRPLSFFVGIKLADGQSASADDLKAAALQPTAKIGPANAALLNASELRVEKVVVSPIHFAMDDPTLSTVDTVSVARAVDARSLERDVRLSNHFQGAQQQALKFDKLEHGNSSTRAELIDKSDMVQDELRAQTAAAEVASRALGSDFIKAIANAGELQLKAQTTLQDALFAFEKAGGWVLFDRDSDTFTPLSSKLRRVAGALRKQAERMSQDSPSSAPPMPMSKIRDELYRHFSDLGDQIVTDSPVVSVTSADVRIGTEYEGNILGIASAVQLAASSTDAAQQPDYPEKLTKQIQIVIGAFADKLSSFIKTFNSRQSSVDQAVATADMQDLRSNKLDAQLVVDPADTVKRLAARTFVWNERTVSDLLSGEPLTAELGTVRVRVVPIMPGTDVEGIPHQGGLNLNLVTTVVLTTPEQVLESVDDSYREARSILREFYESVLTHLGDK